jgi:hypothetical protein
MKRLIKIEYYQKGDYKNHRIYNPLLAKTETVQPLPPPTVLPAKRRVVPLSGHNCLPPLLLPPARTFANKAWQQQC